jgi:hypothetical protein
MRNGEQEVMFEFLKKKKTEPEVVTRISVKRTGNATAHGPGAYANTGVRVVGQVEPVTINGKTCNKGDELPEGVDITWK